MKSYMLMALFNKQLQLEHLFLVTAQVSGVSGHIRQSATPTVLTDISKVQSTTPASTTARSRRRRCPSSTTKAPPPTKTPPSTPNLKTGLVGHWTFDGKDMINNVADSSGAGNTGYAMVAAATSTQQVAGVLGQALKFDGTTQYVTVSDATSLRPAALTDSFWVKTSMTTCFGALTKYDGVGNIVRLNTSGSGCANSDGTIGYFNNAWNLVALGAGKDWR